MMKNIAQKAGLSIPYTNASLRATALKRKEERKWDLSIKSISPKPTSAILGSARSEEKGARVLPVSYGKLCVTLKTLDRCLYMTEEKGPVVVMW